MCVLLLVDYLLSRLHGVVVFEYRTCVVRYIKFNGVNLRIYILTHASSYLLESGGKMYKDRHMHT